MARYVLKRMIYSADELKVMAIERAVLAVYTICQAFSRRDGETILLEALRRWKDTDVF